MSIFVGKSINFLLEIIEFHYRSLYSFYETFSEAQIVLWNIAMHKTVIFKFKFVVVLYIDYLL